LSVLQKGHRTRDFGGQEKKGERKQAGAEEIQKGHKRLSRISKTKTEQQEAESKAGPENEVFGLQEEPCKVVAKGQEVRIREIKFRS